LKDDSHEARADFPSRHAPAELSPGSQLRNALRIALETYLPACLLVATSRDAFSDTIRVPGDQPTIQAAIDAAAKDGTLLVGIRTGIQNASRLMKVSVR
jgi:hypothetical protein